MHGLYIDVLMAEQRSRHEGPVPPVPQLLRQAWVPGYLRVMFPAPISPPEVDTLCACGHPASEHPLPGGCASCGCLGETVRTRP